jgi:hypothetical protein
MDLQMDFSLYTFALSDRDKIRELFRERSQQLYIFDRLRQHMYGIPLSSLEDVDVVYQLERIARWFGKNTPWKLFGFIEQWLEFENIKSCEIFKRAYLQARFEAITQTDELA